MTDEHEPLGMIGPSPSERGLPAIPADPAEHAERSAREWRDVVDAYVRRRMKQLGIPHSRIGSTDHRHGLGVSAFNPYERDAGGVTPDGRLNIDSGVLNPEQMSHLVPPGPQAWREARLRTRIDAAIAHEDMEWRAGTHEAAVELAPETDLPIGEGPRRLLRAIRLGEQGSRGGGPSPHR